MNEHEEALVMAFIIPAKRSRWMQMLSSAKRRRQFLDRLNHCNDLDERYTSAIRSSADIAALLQSRGATAMCAVVSDTPALDGQLLPLHEAVEKAELGTCGTLISCLPGKLAYYYDECGERRLLLERPRTR